MRRIVVTGCLLVSAAHAGEGYFDSARVIESQPIVVSERVPVRSEVCEESKPVPPGDVRRGDPAVSMGELIAADSRRRRPRCRMVTSYETREKTVAWRVTYSYRGEVYMQRMKNEPGERIRVKVELDAG